MANMHLYLTLMVLSLVDLAFLDKCEHMHLSGRMIDAREVNTHVLIGEINSETYLLNCVKDCLVLTECDAITFVDSTSHCKLWAFYFRHTNIKRRYYHGAMFFVKMKDLPYAFVRGLVGSCASSPCKVTERCVPSEPYTCIPWCILPDAPEGCYFKPIPSSQLGVPPYTVVPANCCGRIPPQGTKFEAECLENGTLNLTPKEWACI